MDLAELADVAAALGVDEGDFTDAQQVRVPALLVRASYLFRQAANRQFTPDTYTHRLKVQGTRVRLPETPVQSIDSVTDDSGNTVTYTRNGAWLTIPNFRTANNSFTWYQPSDTEDFVTVTYVGGEIPAAVRDTVASMVARALSIEPAEAGLSMHETQAGPFRERKQYADWATATVSMSDEDREVAESFRYLGTQVVVMRP